MVRSKLIDQNQDKNLFILFYAIKKYICEGIPSVQPKLTFFRVFILNLAIISALYFSINPTHD